MSINRRYWETVIRKALDDINKNDVVVSYKSCDDRFEEQLIFYLIVNDRTYDLVLREKARNIGIIYNPNLVGANFQSRCGFIVTQDAEIERLKNGILIKSLLEYFSRRENIACCVQIIIIAFILFLLYKI